MCGDLSVPTRFCFVKVLQIDYQVRSPVEHQLAGLGSGKCRAIAGHLQPLSLWCVHWH